MTPLDERRRDQRVREAILQAARDICLEEGYGRLTVETIARQAGAGKQTVYRWWPSLHAVVIDAILDTTGKSATFPDTGDLAADLRTQMRALVRQLTSPLMVAYTGLIGAAQTDPELAADLYRRVIGPRVDDCCARIEKAQANGEIRSDVPATEIVEHLYGALYHRLLLSHKKVNNAQVDRILDITFRGLRP